MIDEHIFGIEGHGARSLAPPRKNKLDVVGLKFGLRGGRGWGCRSGMHGRMELRLDHGFHVVHRYQNALGFQIWLQVRSIVWGEKVALTGMDDPAIAMHVIQAKKNLFHNLLEDIRWHHHPFIAIGSAQGQGVLA
jgi:hypothetical protein